VTRGVGAAALAADLPDAVVAVAAFLTNLGAVWFALFLVVVLSVAARRRPLFDAPPSDAATLYGVVLLAFGLTTLLKAVFALPRPPGADEIAVPAALSAVAPAYEYAATGDGPGFPSGHALLTTAFYGTLACSLRVGRRRTRLVAAAGLAVLVSLTRVALGVHYLVDVAVGALLGLALVAVVTRLDAPSRTLAAAAVVALGAVALAPGVESLPTLAAAVAGLLAWRTLPDSTVAG